MKVTLLGSGDAVGVPAPLCDCRYCEEGPRRRRTALLVETDRAAVVLDAGPDVVDQLRVADVTRVDAFFVTHHHYDHVGGLHELDHAAMGFDAHVGITGGYLPPDAFAEEEKPRDPEFAVYLTDTALEHVDSSAPYLREAIEFRTFRHGEAISVGDLSVVPFPVRHGGPRFDTVGFAVAASDSTVAYAPDMWEFGNGDAYADADLLFVEGAALFRAFGHGEEAELRAALSDADADRTVLVNLNEHLQRMTTDELREAAAADGYELGSDFETYRP
ncbi:MBL fold metallo-hydrolase [Halovivax sp.]|uniref:MBL fold metallo-hydrolase n=1 Tax=Halovivax sp. TaxID=1935978 RepID=UPI0025B8DD7C|nr:MBL fold metallo-hydrolase [Halovivax sp.]